MHQYGKHVTTHLTKYYINMVTLFITCNYFNINTLWNGKTFAEFKLIVRSYNLRLQIENVTRIKSWPCIDNVIRNKKICQVSWWIMRFSIKLLKFLNTLSWNFHLQHFFYNTRAFSKENMTKFKDYITVLHLVKKMKIMHLTCFIIYLNYHLCFLMLKIEKYFHKN